MEESQFAQMDETQRKVLLTQSDLNILTMVLGYSKVPLLTRLETLEKASADGRTIGRYILLHEMPEGDNIAEIIKVAEYYAEKMGVTIGSPGSINISETQTPSSNLFKLLDLESLKVAAR